MKSNHFVLKTLPAAIALAFGHAAWAADIVNPGNLGGAGNLPTTGTPTASSNVTVGANGGVSGNTLSMNVSGRAVIDWRTFNVGSGYTVNFNGSGSAVLNRVAAGNNPDGAGLNSSSIGGNLNGNGM